MVPYWNLTPVPGSGKNGNGARATINPMNRVSLGTVTHHAVDLPRCSDGSRLTAERWSERRETRLRHESAEGSSSCLPDAPR